MPFSHHLYLHLGSMEHERKRKEFRVYKLRTIFIEQERNMRKRNMEKEGMRKRKRKDRGNSRSEEALMGGREQ